AEERDEDRQLRVEAEPLRLDVVPELVDEDQQDDADSEPPAPDERVPADREKDPEELETEGAELDEQAERDGNRRRDPSEQRPPRAIVLARQRPRLRRGDRLEVAVVAAAHVVPPVDGEQRVARRAGFTRAQRSRGARRRLPEGGGSWGNHGFPDAVTIPARSIPRRRRRAPSSRAAPSA